MRRLLFFFAIAFVLCGCGGGGSTAGGGGQESASGTGGVELLIRLPQGVARDILAQEMGIDRLDVAILQGGVPILQIQRPVSPNEETIRILIPPLFPGAFSVRVQAYAGTELVAQAEEPLLIAPGVTTTVTLELAQVGLVVTPLSVTLMPGSTRQLTATRDGVPVSAGWMSSDEDVATVDATGVVTAVGLGTAIISAMEGGDVATSTVTVSNDVVLDRIEVTPVNPVLAIGGMQQLMATAFYTDMSTQDVTNLANWTSFNGPVAMVSATGLVTAMAEGSASIQATFEGETDTTTVEVVDPNAPLAFLVIGNPTPGGGSGTITSIQVNQDGTLTVVQDEPIAGRTLGLAATSDGQFVYAATSNRRLFPYAFDVGTGTFSLIGGFVATAIDEAPQSATVHPNDMFVYVTTFFSKVESFTIGAGGTPTVNPPVIATGGPRGFEQLAFNGAGDVAYVPNGSADTITVFDVNTGTGELTYQNPGMPHFPVDAGDAGPSKALVSSDGNFLFVSNFTSSNIRSYPIGPGGVLMNGGSSVGTTTGARALAFHPLQQILYVASDTLQAFTIGAGGVLTPMGTPLAINGASRAVLVDPTGQFLYTVASNNTIDAFTLAPNGAPTFDQTYNVSELSFPSRAIIIPAGGGA